MAAQHDSTDFIIIDYSNAVDRPVRALNPAVIFAILQIPWIVPAEVLAIACCGRGISYLALTLVAIFACASDCFSVLGRFQAKVVGTDVVWAKANHRRSRYRKRLLDLFLGIFVF